MRVPWRRYELRILDGKLADQAALKEAGKEVKAIAKAAGGFFAGASYEDVVALVSLTCVLEGKNDLSQIFCKLSTEYYKPRLLFKHL